MQSLFRHDGKARLSLAFGSVTVLLCILCIAGGSSRYDASGQSLVRGAAWLALIVAIISGNDLSLRRIKWPVIFLGLMAALPILQLIPLPVPVWQALPGRSIFADAAIVSGQVQPWRPWSIAPALTMNAVASLVVPATVLVLVAGLKERERLWMPNLLLGVVLIAMVVGLLKFLGLDFDNPFINDGSGEVGGIFANRNHFALFLSFGCLLAPMWAFQADRRERWRAPVALIAMLLFVMTILATGSRAGILLGAIATCLGLLIARPGISRELRGRPLWVIHATVAAVVGLFAFLVTVTVAMNRAEAINRFLAIRAIDDTRLAALPTVLSMIRTYFPFGTGFGTFDPLFRMNEPHAMLTANYFNHVHNDFLEIALDGGLPAIGILAAALSWWVWAMFQAWRSRPGSGTTRAQAGSAMIFLALVASLFDYPVRTPMIMAMIAIASAWLAEPGNLGRRAPLPAPGHPL